MKTLTVILGIVLLCTAYANANVVPESKLYFSFPPMGSAAVPIPAPSPPKTVGEEKPVQPMRDDADADTGGSDGGAGGSDGGSGGSDGGSGGSDGGSGGSDGGSEGSDGGSGGSEPGGSKPGAGESNPSTGGGSNPAQAQPTTYYIIPLFFKLFFPIICTIFKLFFFGSLFGGLVG